jgi:hypothetical protein
VKRLSVGILTALLLCGVLVAAPPSVKIPAEVKPFGQYVTLTPEGDATTVLYVGLSGLDPIPSAVLKDPRMFLLDTRGLAAGRYKFAAVASGKDGEQLRVDFTVLIGDAPAPPNPPDPPTPPTPTDPLTKDFQAAYDGEADADKASLRTKLASLWRQTGVLAEQKDAAGKYKVETWGALFAAMNEAGRATGVAGKLVAVQTVAQKVMQDRFPSSPEDWKKPMTLDDRKLAADTFKRFAASLEATKGVK